MDISFSFNRRLYGGEKMYKVMAEAGIRALDICIPDTTAELYYTLTGEELDEYIANDRRLIEEAGLYVYQLHGPWREPQDSTEKEREERFEKMCHGIRVLNMLGGKYFVIHPIMPFGFETKTPEEERITWEINKDFFTRLLPVAKEYGVTICLENMPFDNFVLSKPSDIRRFVEEMNDESFMMCLDTGHALVFKDVDLADAVRECGSIIKTLHVHDNRAIKDEHFWPYFGVTEWEKFGKALKDTGYCGTFNLECIEPSRKLPVDIAKDMYAVLYKMSKHIVGEEY